MPESRPRPTRRILSLWFPRLAADRARRAERGLSDAPLAVVAETGNMRVIAALSAEASAAGLCSGQPLQEARALCPDLITRPAQPAREAAFLAALRRWAGRFSPWVADQGADGLLVDLTGCAHLFGGEAALVAQVEADCADLRLAVCVGLADTAGAAWALARHAGAGAGARARNGDAIDQEARATRSRAGKRRHWERGGPAPAAPAAARAAARIAPPGQLRQAIGDLPVAALRLEAETAAALSRLGLRRIRDLFGTPRATLARRFGRTLVQRLDQALGLDPEPIAPARPEIRFAVRLSLPEPIGLETDILAGLDRLLPALCDKLRKAGRGVRRARLDLSRSDGSVQMLEVGLARPAQEPDRLRPLFALKTGGVEAGFGIDMLRLEATVTEPVNDRQVKGGWKVMQEAVSRDRAAPEAALEDLIGRIGARVGLEAITREHPAESHVPEKTSSTQAAAWSEPAPDWPAPPRPRPVILFRPEPLLGTEGAGFPEGFRWRGRNFQARSGIGPERIAPEWWLDDPDWRSGVRDYWRVETTSGARLWLFHAHGGAITGGWFCHGDFG